MIKSMTGFGRGENVGHKKQAVVEIKSVNHRYSEILVKMPRQYSHLEERLRRNILNYISRGRVEVYVKLEDTGLKTREVQVDKELALAYYKALKELAALTDSTFDISVTEIAQLPDVLKIEEPEEDLEEIWKDIEDSLQMAIGSFLEMRTIEGQKLETDLRERLSAIESVTRRIEVKSPQIVDIYRDKLKMRIKEIMDNGQVDENRLALEVALFADKCSIAEEVVRLNSHIQQFLATLNESGAVGRKLDFLLQEMNREVNTIGSKGNDLEITQNVVELKSELEKLREQIQNIE